ncbi:hypothetical protein NO2_0146 [Candidatus Termititenax persephonae]|uniref:Uncharacterized protein n=1 Tax=Candidatus Termititenax persephonae TaxID=2218525 RepID=A0A388TGU7_9BACT|nr:hypothetical protein NO2_0146 [Candidatus Termititenax persephonae]
MTAVKNNGLSLDYLPYKLRNPYICYAACEQNSRAMGSLPYLPGNVEIETVYVFAKEQEIKEYEAREFDREAGLTINLYPYRDQSEIYNGELLAREKARIDMELEKRRPTALQRIEREKSAPK